MNELTRRTPGALIEKLWNDPWNIFDHDHSPLFKTYTKSIHLYQGFTDDGDTYTMEMSLPTGADLNSIEAKIDGNILRISVAKINKSITVNNAEKDNADLTEAQETDTVT